MVLTRSTRDLRCYRAVATRAHGDVDLWGRGCRLNHTRPPSVRRVMGRPVRRLSLYEHVYSQRPHRVLNGSRIIAQAQRSSDENHSRWLVGALGATNFFFNTDRNSTFERRWTSFCRYIDMSTRR